MTTIPSPRLLMILNGKSAGSEPLREAVLATRARGVELGVRVSWEAGDVARYVREAIEDGADTIVAAGGDGTLNAVAGALADRDEPAGQLPTLALVPMGTANDFATSAGIEDSAEVALALAATGAAHPIDLLRVETDDGRSYWCANLASGGFGTQVTAETADGMKKMLGGLAYLVTGIAKAGRIEPLHARIDGPGFEWEGEFIALGVGNGRQAGGGQELCPDALIDDGLLDLTVVPEMEGEVAATLGTAMKQGKEAALERVAVRRRLDQVGIQAPEPFTLNLDGEPVQARRFRLHCHPGRLRMHLPDDSPLLSPANR